MIGGFDNFLKSLGVDISNLGLEPEQQVILNQYIQEVDANNKADISVELRNKKARILHDETMEKLEKYGAKGNK